MAQPEPVTAVKQKVVVKPDPTQSGNDPGQSTFQLNDDDDVDNGYQPLDDQPITAPQPPPQPAQLEELQTIVRQRRPPRLLSSICEDQLALTSFVRCVSQPALLAIVEMQVTDSVLPHPAHHLLTVHSPHATSTVSEAVIADIQDTAYDEPLCFFLRTLRIPQKEIHLHPDVVAARKKEIQGLFKVGCFRWVPRANAYRDNIKPIHTGFVDAVKIDEATGSQKFKSKLVMFGNLMSAFSHYSP
eukprot:g76920.t1